MPSGARRRHGRPREPARGRSPPRRRGDRPPSPAAGGGPPRAALRRPHPRRRLGAGARPAPALRRRARRRRRGPDPARPPRRARPRPGPEPRPRRPRPRGSGRRRALRGDPRRHRAARGQGARREPGQVAQPLPLRARGAHRDRQGHLHRARDRQAPRPHPGEEPLHHRRRRREHLRGRGRRSRALRAHPPLQALAERVGRLRLAGVHDPGLAPVDVRLRRAPQEAALHPRRLRPPGALALRLRPLVRRQDRLPHAIDALRAPLLAGRRRGRRDPAPQQEARSRAAPALRRGRRRAGGALRRPERGAARHRGLAGRHRPGERLPLHRDPAHAGGLRPRLGGGHRAARSDHQRPLAARLPPHGRAGPRRRARRRRPLPRRDLVRGRPPRAGVRLPPPRLRQDRRARGGPPQGEEALPLPARRPPRPLRARRPQRRGRHPLAQGAAPGARRPPPISRPSTRPWSSAAGRSTRPSR